MKTKNSLLVLLLALSNNALAQTSSTTVVSTPATTSTTSSTTATSTNSSVANAGAIVADPSKPQLRIKYLGIFKGPGLNSESLTQASGDPGELEHRFKFLVQTSEKLDFGIETRIRTILGNGSLSVLNGDYRAVANFKHVFKNDLLDFSLSPRIKLPTSSSAIKKELLFAPELLANLDISPKNTRFSFNTGMLYQHSLYKASAANTVTTSVVNPWFETDYQINEKVSAMVSIWPDFAAQGKSGAAAVNDSNEIDVGANWEFIKGWTASPYISLEPVGLDTSSAASAAKNMQFNMYVSGAFL